MAPANLCSVHGDCGLLTALPTLFLKNTLIVLIPFVLSHWVVRGRRCFDLKTSRTPDTGSAVRVSLCNLTFINTQDTYDNTA